MIGGSILAGVGLAGAYMFKNQKMAQKRIDHDQTLNIFHQNILRQMNNPFNCNATLRGFYGQASIPANTDVTLYNCGSGCSDLKSDAGAVSQGTALLGPTNFIDGTQVWQVSSIKTGPNPVSATGPVVLSVTYQMNPNKFPSARSVSKQIILNARFATTGATPGFRECFNSQESSVNNLQNDICKSLTAVTSTGSVVATWDEATQSCKTVGDSTNKLKDCPPGTVIEGIRSDGSVHCKQPVSGVGDCPAGQTLTVTGSGPTMRIQCL